MPPTNDKHDHHGRPTEEIYLELRELEELRELAKDDLDENEPAPAMIEDDPASLKARIARLRAMLTDRGAPLDG